MMKFLARFGLTAMLMGVIILPIFVDYSLEYDFSSVGVNAAIARDFNSKNTTLSLGVNLESATINAAGGIPNPLTNSESAINNDDASRINAHPK